MVSGECEKKEGEMARMKAELVMEIGDDGVRLFAEAYDGGGRLFERKEVAVAVEPAVNSGGKTGFAAKVKTKKVEA